MCNVIVSSFSFAFSWWLKMLSIYPCLLAILIFSLYNAIIPKLSNFYVFFLITFVRILCNSESSLLLNMKIFHIPFPVLGLPMYFPNVIFWWPDVHNFNTVPNTHTHTQPGTVRLVSSIFVYSKILQMFRDNIFLRFCCIFHIKLTIHLMLIFCACDWLGLIKCLFQCTRHHLLKRLFFLSVFHLSQNKLPFMWKTTTRLSILFYCLCFLFLHHCLSVLIILIHNRSY